jgi:two-component system response regulator FixJ
MSPKRMRVYIIDDDLSFGRSLKRLLNVRGISADFFESAAAFLDSVPAEEKAIAIVDIHMPGCDGFELMTQMHELRYRMPVILVTGRTEGYTRDTALKMGAVGFLQKPFKETSLLELMKRVEEERNDTKLSRRSHEIREL